MKTLLRSVVFIFLLSEAFALAAAYSAPRGLTTLTGRIVAYRPFDRIAQVISHVLNSEVFLFAIDSADQRKGPRIFKIKYEHTGYSDIADDILNGGRLLKMKVRRDPTCDEYFGHFASTATVVKGTGDSSGQQKTSNAITFTGGFKGSDLSPNLKLECYALQNGDFQVAHQ